MPRAGGGVGGGLCVTGDREGSNVSGAPAEAGGIPRVRIGSHIGIASDTLSELEHRGVGRPGGGHTPTPPRREAHTYPVSFPKHLSRLRCLVAGCLGGASSQTNLRVHFAHRHVRDAIVILEEGNCTYPRCPQCDMFVPQKYLIGQHLATSLYRRGMERKWRRLSEEEAQEERERILTDY